MQIPGVILPAIDDRPDVSAREQLDGLTHLYMGLEALRADIRAHVLSGTDLRDRLSALGTLARAAAQERSGVEPAVQTPGADPSNDEIYDKFFHVRRAAGMGGDAFLTQALHVHGALLDDLGESLIGRDEVAALLDALVAQLETFGASHTGGNGSLTVQAASTPQELDGARVWYRWVTGHHTFALCAIFAREALLRASDALRSGDAAGVEAALLRAGVYVRATASAMWYTADFPISFYMEKLRPAMQATGARGGFSGTQNADYERFKNVREALVEALFETYGDLASQWPRNVLAALLHFHELEVQAAEHHVLVAASKVQLDQSLSQKATQPGSPESAVDVLREMVDAAANDISDRFRPEGARDVRACGVDEVPAEHPLRVSVDGMDLVICRAYGALWACAGTCTHAGADLSEGHMAADELVCPLHGGKFDPRTGQPLHRPATEPLRTYPVSVRDGGVFVRLA